MPSYVLPCGEITNGDRNLVGAKSFGVRRLIESDMPVPQGISLTTEAFSKFIEDRGFKRLIPRLKEIDRNNLEQLAAAADHIQKIFSSTELPAQIRNEVVEALEALGKRSQTSRPRFAVRSSCNYEDLEGMSFAGLYRSFINVVRASIFQSIIGCYASLYLLRSLIYIREHNVDLEEIQMGVLIQESVAAESAGTIFTADVNSGFDGVHQVEGVWGLGEGVVAGKNTPNAWTVFKRSRKIIGRSLGHAEHMYVGADADGVECVKTPDDKKYAYSLTDEDVYTLTQYASRMEEEEKRPLDIEWVKSKSGELFLLQMRPLGVRKGEVFTRYTLSEGRDDQPILRGMPITEKAVSGRVRVASGKLPDLSQEDILVVKYLDVDWLPFLKNVGGVIVEGGGFTSHISIILREHAIPSIFGAEGACDKLTEGELITLVCSSNLGAVWLGELSLTKECIDVSAIKKTRHKICVVTSTLANLDQYLRLPVDGIGLVRLEFLVYQNIGIHPLALIDYDAGKLQHETLRAAIEDRTRGYASKREFYIDKLTEGICAFASRCPDKIVNVRVPDFITGDYLTLLGGQEYEHYTEANPMMGWRGTSRLIDEEYVAAFELDCEAFRRVIDEHGFSNVNVLVPFCRTPKDGELIRTILKGKGPADATVGMMVEVPSNVMLARQFAEIFDFFLVGPMDLTQLTYGADRSSFKMSKYCNETEAVKEMVKYFFYSIRDYSKDVFIGGWPLFRHLQEYKEVQGNNRIHMVELPDRLLELFDNVHELEKRLEDF
jgi:pyruvate,water dikinase